MSRFPVQDPATPAPTDSTRADFVRRTAARLFQESGYSATTVNDIADAVGMLPGSLYHHFTSKEEIAVLLIAGFNERRAELGAQALSRLRDGGASPEDLLRQLTADMTELSYEHGAAVRLRGWEAPSVATERMSQALRATSPTLERAWKIIVARVAEQHPEAKLDTLLLRFALEQSSLGAVFSYPTDWDPRLLGERLCNVLLQGLVTTLPTDTQLDRSPALQAANDAIARWPHPQAATSRNGSVDIIAAARTEFARRGYEATTIRDIARSAGVAMGTLYRRVESKEWLVRQVLQSYAISLDDANRAVLSSDSSLPEKLDALAWVFVRSTRHFADEGKVVTFVWGGRESPSSPVHDFFTEARDRLREMEKLFSRGVKEGTLRPIGAPIEDALHFRTVAWLRYHTFGRTGDARAHAFLRNTLLRGAVNAP